MEYAHCLTLDEYRASPQYSIDRQRSIRELHPELTPEQEAAYLAWQDKTYPPYNCVNDFILGKR